MKLRNLLSLGRHIISVSMVRLPLRASIAVLLLASLALGSTAAAAKPKSKKPPSRHHGSLHVRQRHVLIERHVSATRAGQPNVQALGALVLDDAGRIVYARNPDKERPIASISKLAATLAVVDKGIELEGLTTITKTDVEVAKGGARSRLLEGMTLSNRDLLHAALMGSDNRAIPALGRAAKMNPTQLTAAMNAKARQLGLKNTRFHEPTGLSTGNVSTPRETILMLKQVVANPILGAITRRDVYDAHPVGKPPLRYVNTDHFAQRGNVQVVGGKTGYNDDARYCLVVACKIDGRPYYMSFLGNEGKLTRFGDVARVADWVVSHPAKPGAPGKPGDEGRTEVATASADSPPLPVGVAAPPEEAPAQAAPAPAAAASPAAPPEPAPANATATP
jgi:D-alanyl-D-alanine endopeptidase (penicillin-binding protein 7)